MEKIQIIKEIKNSTEKFIQILSEMSQSQINEVPDAGGWTAAQVTWHVHLSDEKILEWIRGQGKIPNRNPAANCSKIKLVFEDFTKKFDSPSFIVPKFKMYQKEALKEFFLTTRNELLEELLNLDLSSICLDITFEPLKGFTRFELAYFVILHTNRHLYQLRNIKKLLDKNLFLKNIK